MSLDTVLQIGKVLRNSENSLKYFKYVEPCPKDRYTNRPIYITIPVNHVNFSFDWEKLNFTKENEYEYLMYLKFKTSDSDNNPIKYLFGDIYYGLDKGSDKGGWFKLTKTKNKKGDITTHSFYEGEKFANELLNKNSNLDILTKFRKSFEANLSVIENILKYHIGIELVKEEYTKLNINILEDETEMMRCSAHKIFNSLREKKQYKKEIKKVLKRDIIDWSEVIESDYINLWKAYTGSVFLHFEFSNPDQRYWYDYSEVVSEIQHLIYQKFSSRREIEKEGKNAIYYVFDSYLYKNLCTGTEDNDKQSPGFNNDTKYKSKAFSFRELQDLFYGDRHCSKESKLVSISGTDIQIIVLPLGDNLKEKDYRDFLFKNGDENRINQSNKTGQSKDNEPLFSFLSNESESITKFDMIFCKKGGQSSPDKDIIELSGLEKSRLRLTRERITKISQEIMSERKRFMRTENDLFPITIDYSFRNILGNPQTDAKTGKVTYKVNPKYQSHLFKVLPLIYTNNYSNDEILLSAFVQNVEFSIRSGDERYRFLKYDLIFLINIQNSQTNKLKAMVESTSYQIGIKLGKLAKPLKRKISSFEKRYVGFLTRHVSTKDDCVKFSNDINEMLIRHEKTWLAMSAEICSQLANIPLSEYDKEELAFGFFEGYFNYEATDKRKDFFSRLEKLISDYEGNPDLENEVEKISAALNELNQ